MHILLSIIANTANFRGINNQSNVVSLQKLQLIASAASSCELRAASPFASTLSVFPGSIALRQAQGDNKLGK